MAKRQMLFVAIVSIFMSSFTFSITETVRDKFMQDYIENVVETLPWIEENKEVSFVRDAQRERDNEQTVLLQKILVVCTEMLLLQKEGRDIQIRQYDKQNQQYGLQKQQYNEQLHMQKQRYDVQQRRYDMVSHLLQEEIRQLELLRQELIKCEEEGVRNKIKNLSDQKEHFDSSFELQAKSSELQAKLLSK